MSFTAPGAFRKEGQEEEVEAEEYEIPTQPPIFRLLLLPFSRAQIALYPYKPFIQWISKNGEGWPKMVRLDLDVFL
jgi:hypothetical protein